MFSSQFCNDVWVAKQELSSCFISYRDLKHIDVVMADQFGEPFDGIILFLLPPPDNTSCWVFGKNEWGGFAFETGNRCRAAVFSL